MSAAAACRRYPECSFPEGRCARAAEFGDPAAECPDLQRDTSRVTSVAPSLSPAPTSSRKTPWSGRHLSVNDAWALTRVSPVRLVAVIGPYNAGKTSLIASLFLQLANGRRPGFPYRFAGCRTLYSFERLVQQAATYKARPGEIVVDHTPKSETADQGTFLHLGLRSDDARDDRVQEVLLSDVPGEWFSEWASHDEETAQRRLGFLNRCGAVIVLADAEALFAEAGGTYDGNTALVLRRLVEHGRARRWAPRTHVVFTKLDRVADRVAPPTRGAEAAADWGALRKHARRTWSAVRALREEGATVNVAGVAAFPCPLADGQPYGVTELFGDVLGALDAPMPGAPLTRPILDGRAFSAMRRERS